MRRRVGVWIDHRKAIVVVMTDDGDEVGVVVSKVESKLRHPGDAPAEGSREAQKVPADDKRQRNITAHLNVYYDGVIAMMGDAEAILVFGPGEAKGELKKRLDKAKLGARVVGLETADKLTERQITTKVRKHFAN